MHFSEDYLKFILVKFDLALEMRKLKISKRKLKWISSNILHAYFCTGKRKWYMKGLQAKSLNPWANPLPVTFAHPSTKRLNRLSICSHRFTCVSL